MDGHAGTPRLQLLMRMRWRTAAGALTASLVLATAACTSGTEGASHPPAANPRQAVLASVTDTESADSAAFDFSVSVDGTPQLGGLSQAGGSVTSKPVSLAISGHGLYSFSEKTGETTISLPSIGQTPAQAVQVRQIGNEVYLSSPRISAADGGKAWVSVSLSDYQQSQGQSSPAGDLSLGDPTQILGLLKQLSGSVTQVGTSDIDGVPTTEYAGTIDLAGNGTTGSTFLSPQFGQILGLSAIPIDVWVDGQGRARQVQTSFSVLGLTVKALVHLGSFGTPVSVQAPPSDQVVDGTGLLGNGQLGSLFGATA